MILCIINIALALSCAAAPIYLLITVNKRGIPIAKPLLMGAAAMGVGYIGASFALLIINGISEAAGLGTFLESEMAYFYLASFIALILSLMMTVFLTRPLKDRLSGFEALAFALGVALPMLAYRVVGVTWTSIAYIQSGVDAAGGAMLLVDGLFSLVTAFVDAFCAVMLAYFVAKGKPWRGFALAFAAEFLTNASSSVQDAFGWPAIVYPVVTSAVCIGLLVFDMRIWKDFPERKRDVRVRRGSSNIQWPEPGDDGGDAE